MKRILNCTKTRKFVQLEGLRRPREGRGNYEAKRRSGAQICCKR
jgi:hypothetical protein